MNKAEKKKVRQNILMLLDSKCKGCEIKGDCRSRDDYCYTKCPIGFQLRDFSKMLSDADDPKGSKTKWSPDEELYLLNHYLLYDRQHLSERLNHSLESIEHKLKQIQGSKEQLDPQTKKVTHVAP